MAKENLAAVFFYLVLVWVLLLFLFLYGFQVRDIAADSFTKFLMSLLVVVLLLPSVTRIKIFDLVEVTKGAKMLLRRQ